MRAEEVTGILLAGGRSSRMGRNKALLPVGGKPLLRLAAEAMLALGLRRVVVACGPAERANEYGPLLAGLPGEIGFAADRFPDSGPLAGLHAALTSMPAPGYGFAMACDMPALSAPLLARLLRAAAEAGPGGAGWPDAARAVGVSASEPAGNEVVAGPGEAGAPAGGIARGAAGAPPNAAEPAAATAAAGGAKTEGREAFRGPQLIRAAGQPFHALYHTSAAAELASRLARGDLRVMALAGALRTLELTPGADEEGAFANLNTPDAYERYVRLGEQPKAP
ncbi:molybdopterin-guanine dinucleotide biosynthesis protein A [Paenibacillus sp. UNC496MF]|uniref:molybdenum cofactor guanylyltransferase n=1 Tax=Paenibacillus sp. UNC496MF TaxID=1502753 RepID=UPI0008E41222|nr:molybdenum cofactor guanylyltransferase [Paenibacillus sp. UNC496MF]SFJ24375.1 molybdopterin-guanine dinucleotide biosynthesis protein A [Paenibacillus sp. UNC496MF]